MDISKITTSEWVIIFATLMGPILAVQAQKFLEGLREHRNGKLWVFRTLMTTRRQRVSIDHVRALNMIDVSFYGIRVCFKHWQTRAEKKVAGAWKGYLDNLTTETEGWPEARLEVLWSDREKLFSALLVAIAASVDFNFDELHIRKAGYIPIAHSDTEIKQQQLLDSAVGVLQGRQTLKMDVVSFPPNEQTAAAHRQMISQLVAASKDGVLKVSVANVENQG